MSKLTKNQKLVADKVEAGKAYTLKEAAALVKEITTTKFEASVDIDVRLGVDPRKANQMVRGVLSVHPTRKLLPRRQVPTTLVLTSISTRLSRVGLMLMSSSPCRLAWVSWVLSVVFWVPVA